METMKSMESPEYCPFCGSEDVEDLGYGNQTRGEGGFHEWRAIGCDECERYVEISLK